MICTEITSPAPSVVLSTGAARWTRELSTREPQAHRHSATDKRTRNLLEESLSTCRSQEPPHAQVDLVAVELQIVAGGHHPSRHLRKRIHSVLELPVVSERGVDADRASEPIFEKHRGVDPVLGRVWRLLRAAREE